MWSAGGVEISPAWAAAIAAWLVALRAAGKPATTLRLRRYQLGRVAAGVAPVGPWELTSGELVAWLGGQDWQTNTRRSWRSAIRGFYGWARGAGLVDTDPSLALPRVPQKPPAARPTPEDAYRLALTRSDDRVRLMLRLAAELGMRRGEVAHVHRDDLERDLMGWTLLVHGKGGKVRRLPVDDGLAATLRRYAGAGGWVFPGAINGHLSAQWVGKLVARALPGAWAMHSLRHRFANIAYSHERDTFAVQELLGHASPATTRIYVVVPSDALRRTVAAVARVV